MDTQTNFSMSNGTVRLFLAAIAMHGIVTHYGMINLPAIEMAEYSVKYADALIKKLREDK